MTKFGKFLVGAAVTSLLAWGAHAMTGRDYIDRLGSDGTGALSAGGFDGVTLAMASDPLARVAVLSGISDPDARARAEAAVLAVPGIASVRWADGEVVSAPVADAPSEPATAQEVTACQDNIDGLMAGKVINFASGSATIAADGLAVVSEVAEALSGCDGMAIAVGGHTDATGSAEVNQRLSKERADSVAAALAERGIAAERITATGYGSAQPVMEGTGAAANAANRRIEFDLSTSAAAAAPTGEE